MSSNSGTEMSSQDPGGQMWVSTSIKIPFILLDFEAEGLRLTSYSHHILAKGANSKLYHFLELQLTQQ